MHKIGGEASMRYGTGLLAWVDMYAKDQGVTRAAAVRAILGQYATSYARAHGRQGTDTIVEWRIVRPGDGAAASSTAAP
jgi:hypothetical protein